jgi:hypothetical protein
MGTARSRLAENGAIARAVLNGPDVFSVRFGAGMLQDLAVLPLAALEERTGNRVAAESLRVAVERVREEAFAAHWDEGFAGLASDPRHPELLLKAARNPSFPKGLRAAAGAGVLMGICLNPREILSGIDPGRAATMTVLLGEESPRPPTASNPDTTRSALGRSGIGDLFRRLSSCP